MRLAFALPLLAILGVAWVPITASQACPRLVIKAKGISTGATASPFLARSLPHQDQTA